MLEAALHRELEELYAHYARLLDDGPLQEWPALFTDPCVYQVIPRDNFDAGLPLENENVLLEARNLLVVLELLAGGFVRELVRVGVFVKSHFPVASDSI